MTIYIKNQGNLVTKTSEIPKNEKIHTDSEKSINLFGIKRRKDTRQGKVVQ